MLLIGYGLGPDTPSAVQARKDPVYMLHALSLTVQARIQVLQVNVNTNSCGVIGEHTLSYSSMDEWIK